MASPLPPVPSGTLFSKRPLPVCVYVYFHPESHEGPVLADAVFRWLRLKEDAAEGGASALPVYYRAHLEGGALETVPRSDALHNFLVILVDDAMATDRDWRAALKRQVDAARDGAGAHLGAVHVLPVMVSKSFDQLAFIAAHHNPIRIYADGDPNITEPPVKGAENLEEKKLQWSERMGHRSRRLRRQLVEAMIRRMREPDPNLQPPRLKVFISHAKADGAGIATQLRDGLAQISQFEPWFDVNDLSPGSTAADHMARAAQSSSGGMVAVLSDAYPTRPWCRFEARMARQPMLAPVRGAASRPLPYFQVQPMVAVQVAADKWSTHLGPVASVHRIGWPAAGPTNPGAAAQRVADVVDRLLLEVLLNDVFAHHVNLIDGMTPDGAKRNGTPDGVYFLGFTPDAWSLALVRANLPEDRLCSAVHLVFPGRALRQAEREEIDELVQAMFPSGSTAVPFEDWLLSTEGHDPAALRPAAHPKVMGLSAGGTPAELWASGVGIEHVNDLMVRLTRHLLKRGHRVAYGGDLASENNLTLAILDAAEGWRTDLGFRLDAPAASTSELNERIRKRVDEGERALNSPPVVNYSAWPRSEQVTLARRGQHLGTCSFVSIDPPDGQVPWKAIPAAERAREANLHTARALRHMRDRMAQDCHLRVLFAGKVHGSSGWLPGIAEELLAALVRRPRPQPFLLLGGFGGCAGLLADVLQGGSWPTELTYEAELAYRAGKSANAAAAWLDQGTPEAERRTQFELLRTTVLEFRAKKFGSGSKPVLGVPKRLWLDCLTATSPTRVVDLVRRALEALR